MIMDNSFYPIKKKIEEIGSALIYSLSNYEMKLCTQIISTTKVDDGIIWFMVPRSDFNTNCETSFPVQLDYYRKGKLFYLQVYGTANFILREEELNCLPGFTDEMKVVLKSKMMLVSVIVSRIDLYEYQEKEKNRGWLKHIANNLYESLFPSTVHETFHFSGLQSAH